MTKSKVTMSSRMEENGRVLHYKLDIWKVFYHFYMVWWCAHHCVRYFLQLGKSFETKWPETSSLAPGPKVKDIF